MSTDCCQHVQSFADPECFSLWMVRLRSLASSENPEAKKPAELKMSVQPGHTSIEGEFLAGAFPEALSSHPFKVVLRADGQIACTEAVDIYPVLPKDLAFPVHVKNTFLDFDTEIPPCDFVRFCTEPADVGRA